MRVARVKVSAGKPGEENAGGIGYAASGASQYSRRVSVHASPADLVTNVDRPPRLVALLAKHEVALGKYQAKLQFARDPKERARLQRHIAIKMEFMERLKRDRTLQLKGTSHAQS